MGSGPLGRGRRYPDERARIQDLLDTYTPRFVDESTWTAIRPFVVQHATVLFKDMERYHHANQFMANLARLTAHAYLNGIDLVADEVFRPERIEHLIANGLATVSERSKGTFRSRLRWACRKLAPGVWPPEETKVSRTQVTPPYSDKELQALGTMVAAIPSPRLRELGEIVLVLGLGAGADGSDIPRLRGEDIIITEDPDTVYVLFNRDQSDERIVPVLPRYSEAVREIGLRVGANELVIGHPNRINSELGKIRATDPEWPVQRIKIARLRSTYIVDLINENVPIRVLLAVTGLGFSSRLAHYASFANEVFFEDIEDAIRQVQW